jgi:hypothetical protein
MLATALPRAMPPSPASTARSPPQPRLLPLASPTHERHVVAAWPVALCEGTGPHKAQRPAAPPGAPNAPSGLRGDARPAPCRAAAPKAGRRGRTQYPLHRGRGGAQQELDAALHARLPPVALCDLLGEPSGVAYPSSPIGVATHTPAERGSGGSHLHRPLVPIQRDQAPVWRQGLRRPRATGNSQTSLADGQAVCQRTKSGSRRELAATVRGTPAPLRCLPSRAHRSVPSHSARARRRETAPAGPHHCYCRGRVRTIAMAVDEYPVNTPSSMTRVAPVISTSSARNAPGIRDTRAATFALPRLGRRVGGPPLFLDVSSTCCN